MASTLTLPPDAKARQEMLNKLHDRAIEKGRPGVIADAKTLVGSRAAEHLGIAGSTTGASLIGADRATVAADGVFSHLIALRDALATNDETGIEIAAERLELDFRRVAESRAEVGVKARRVSDSILRQEDLRIQDMGLRSQVQDLDYTEAAVRFSILQQQLQAGLTVASQTATLSLLDFIG